MSLNRLFDPLGFHTDITLRDRRAAVLKQPLHERDIVTVVLVDFGGVPFSETVCTDSIIPKIITNKLDLLLDSPFCYWEDQIGWLDAISQAIILDILLNNKWNSKDSVFPGFLLYDIQAVPVTVTNDVGEMETQDVADPEPQIRLQYKSRRNPLIRAAATKALLHR